jgi:hypothetical protein
VAAEVSAVLNVYSSEQVSWARVNLSATDERTVDSSGGVTRGSGRNSGGMTRGSGRNSGGVTRGSGSGGLTQSMKIYHVDGRFSSTEHLDWGAIHLVPLGGAAAKGWMGSR